MIRINDSTLNYADKEEKNLLEESWQSVYSFHRDKSLGIGWRWAKNKPNDEKRRISRINYRRRKGCCGGGGAASDEVSFE